VLARVHALELLARGLGCLAAVQARGEAGTLDGGEDGLQALRRFGIF